EIEVISRISHPNIVHAFDAGSIGGNLVLAMELVDGVDLDRRVKLSGPLPIAEACAYIQQAARGLQYAHEQGLGHRDIKPSNLLLSVVRRPPSAAPGVAQPAASNGQRAVDDGQIKILDLGLARLQQQSEGSRTDNLTLLVGNGMTQGTPDYMAPEQ